MSLTIKNAGILSIIVDSGRFGCHSIGLTTGGPFDRSAFDLANALVGNSPTDAAVEVTLGGFEAQCHSATSIAVTGARVDLTIDGVAQPLATNIQVPAGSVIKLGMATQGCRAYIALSGGIDCPDSFGSKTTVMREHIGGLFGDKLKAGDPVPLAPAKQYKERSSEQPAIDTNPTLRVVMGYQQQNFSEQAKRRFFTSQFTVSQRFDRMGCRVEGPDVAADIDGILSEGICLGAIQVPADGQPIILLNDRQTIGGYPKIGSVITGDIDKLAQLKPGDTVNFEPISINEAHNIAHLQAYKQSRLLEQLDD